MKRRALISSAATIVAIATVAVVLTVPNSSVVTPKAMAQPGPPGITVDRLGTTLARVGLTAENLAAAGADATDTTAVVVGMRAYLSSNGVDLYEADQAKASATTTHDGLLRLVQRGQRDQQTMEDFAAAKTALASAALELQSELDAAFQQASSGLSLNQRALIARIHANKAVYNMPTDVAAGTWTEADWLALRGALASIRQADAAGVAPDDAAQTIVDQAMVTSGVASAESDLTGSLDACSSAWDTAVQTYGAM